MRWRLLVVALVCAGCPEIERMTYRFDLKAGRGSLALVGIGTSEPDAAPRDFAALVNEYLLGNRLVSDHPGWSVEDRELFEQAGRLDGRVEFTFDSAADAGLYKHDKKSGYLWCTGEGTEIVATNGTIVPLYPRCVIFDRKLDVVEVTVTTIQPDDVFQSLLPVYARWDGGPIGKSAVLSELLADVPVPEVWRAAGLPLPGGTVVFASEAGLEATHPGATGPVLAKYTRALAADGFAEVERGDDRSAWSRGGETWYVSATQAGANVLVSLRRRAATPEAPTDPN